VPAGQVARSVTVGSARGLARRADGVSPALGLLAGCAAQVQGCAVAQPCAPDGALMRHVRNQAHRAPRRGARHLASCRPPGRLPRRLTLSVAGLATADG
jgi:hypothetical protein